MTAPEGIEPGSEERAVELLAHAESVGAEVGVVGSGSNLLVADDGFRGLVLKLDGDLAQIERDGAVRMNAYGGELANLWDLGEGRD